MSKQTKIKTSADYKREESEWEYKQRIEAEKRYFDFTHNVITSINMLAGWEIIELIRWKPGVVQYIAERSLHEKRERMIGYAKDEVFASVQLPPNAKDQATRGAEKDA